MTLSTGESKTRTFNRSLAIYPDTYCLHFKFMLIISHVITERLKDFLESDTEA